MTSTEFSIGLGGDNKSSSRVLKPPGGGHTNIFGGEGEAVKVINPRPKYDQQNSSNLNFCMNTTDPNVLVEQKKKEVDHHKEAPGAPASQQQQQQQEASAQPQQPQGRSRVPPGGFSSGLW